MNGDHHCSTTRSSLTPGMLADIDQIIRDATTTPAPEATHRADRTQVSIDHHLRQMLSPTMREET